MERQKNTAQQSGLGPDVSLSRAPAPAPAPAPTLLSRANLPSGVVRPRHNSTGVQPTTDISGGPPISNPICLRPAIAVASGHDKSNPKPPRTINAYVHRPNDGLGDFTAPDLGESYVALDHGFPLPFDSNQNMLAYADRAAPQSHSFNALSAEQYDDGTRIVRPKIPSIQLPPQRNSDQFFGLTGGVAPRSRSPASGGQNGTEGKLSVNSDPSQRERRRKKMKPSDDEELDEDDGIRRVRGRPRLETKDETAADRRRTQIRMAQRAYRHRKETTILSLEKQVQELRGVTEEMSNIFLNLHDFAVCKGLLEREPEFGSQMRCTTERFLELAKVISTDENFTEEAASVESSKHSRSDTDLAHPCHPQESRQTPIPQDNQRGIHLPMGISPWGYQVNHEPTHIGDLGLEQQNFLSPAPQENRQIIRGATLDNASFSFDYLEDLRQYRVEIPEGLDVYNIYDSLSPVKTLSQHESSFGRHLQRLAYERGYDIVTSEYTPELDRIFGFCRRFESLENIAKRLKRGLEATAKDPLFNWSHPFVHLGGSGTYYPPDENISGTPTPVFPSGMSVGPFSSQVVSTIENLVEKDFQITLAGFEGEFFDSYEVEKYLQVRGINIPSNAEFVTVDLDLLSTNDLQSPQSVRSESDHNTRYLSDAPLSWEFHHLPTETSSDVGVFGLINDSGLDFSASPTDYSKSPTGHSKSPTGHSFDLDEPFFNSVPIPQNLGTEISSIEGQMPNSRLATLSVSVLIEELLHLGVCIGRGAGFRPSDVDIAVKRALKRSI